MSEFFAQRLGHIAVAACRDSGQHPFDHDAGQHVTIRVSSRPVANPECAVMPARPKFVTETVKARPGYPGLFGAAGALKVLHDAWGDHADDTARTVARKKHASILERLAIPERLATEWCGYPSSLPGLPHNLATPDALGAAGVMSSASLPPNTTEGNRVIFRAWEDAGGMSGGTTFLAARPIGLCFLHKESGSR